MKYLISRIEHVKDKVRTVLKAQLETENIEQTRKELRQAISTDRVLFIYEELPQKLQSNETNSIR